MKGLKEDNRGVILPIKTLLAITVICIVIFLFIWADSLKVICNPEDKVELKGLLRGFTKNDSYWNIKIDNQTYVFNVFNEDYMKNMIGYNVTLTCCYRHDTSYRIGYYDLVNCFINEVVKT